MCKRVFAAGLALSFALVLKAQTAETKSFSEPQSSTKPVGESLEALALQLKEAVAAGKLTEAAAWEKYKKAAQAQELAQGAHEDEIDFQELGAKLKQAVANGTMTEEQAKAKFVEMTRSAGAKQGGKSGQMKMKGQPGLTGSFYSIVIGRLKSKDIELGEFSLEVDHVTSIYGDARRRDEIVGQTVQVVGVSGPWLDKLLLIKRGETLKFRSGTLHDKTMSLSPKATVLERALPFDPEVYPVPPAAFRGFRGVLTGKIEEKSDSGYELTLRVEVVEETSEGNNAAEPRSIEGRLLDVRGFYENRYRATFENLRLGDQIRIGLSHAIPQEDNLSVSGVLQKL